jgi:hypothetical protein
MEQNYDDVFLGLGFSTIFLISLFIIIIYVVANWKIYVKAGEDGWLSIIPLLNFYVLLKIVGKPGWWLLLYLIPGVNIVIIIWVTNLLSKSFGKDELFTIGLIFFGIIFYPILGFGDAKYLGPAGDEGQAAAQNG